MYLGLDLGTSGIKGILIDDAQNVVATASAPLSAARPHSGWSEQHPEDWISATEAVLDAIKAQHPAALAALRAIGLAGQMHGATLVDSADKVLRPCILWNDTRSHLEAAKLDTDPQFRSISGNIVFPGFTAPKLVWVQTNEPEIFAQTAKVLLPKDFLRLWLTGEYVSDMSDAAGTGWLDVGARCWSAPLLAASGMTLDQMPDLVEGSDASGTLRASLAQRWGLPSGVVVAGGGGDNAASAVGMGVIEAEQAFLSLGTSGVLFAANKTYAPNPESAVHTFCHSLPGTWHQMGVILAATDALNWYALIAGRSAKELTQELGDKLASPGSCRFLPYLGGERTPHNDATVRGGFLGLSHHDDRAALTRAVLEGVAFAFRDNLEALRSTGTSIDRVFAVGGGSLSIYWLKIIATVLNLPVDIPQDGDFGAAFGAARLGLIAATGVSAASVCHQPDIKQTILPDAPLQPPFEDAYWHFAKSYSALKAT